MIEKAHKGWHSRGYLPHLDAANEIQSVTFRLADALPRTVIEKWKAELEELPASEEKKTRALRTRIAKYEDAGHGSCLLRDARCADIVQESLFHFDPERYCLLEWCIMPNHVHVLIHLPPGARLGEVVGSWKGYTAGEINRRFERKGQLWEEDYHDRYIRDELHLSDIRSYIRNNPVTAGLCASPADWPWGSAGHRAASS